MNKRNTANCYATINVGLNAQNLCVANEMNRFAVMQATNGVIIDFIGNLHESSNICSLRHVEHVNGKSPQHDMRMAFSMQNEIESTGMVIEGDFYKKHTKMLIATNIITGLCYKLVKKREGGYTNCWVTKNLDIIKLMCNRYNYRCNPKELEKYVDKFFLTTEELNNGVLNCVRVSVKNGVIKLGAEKVNVNSKTCTLLPLFVVSNFVNCVVRNLGKRILTIRLAGSTTDIRATLNEYLINQNTKYPSSRIVNHAYVPDDMGALLLFDLNTQKFVRIQVTDISSIS